MGIYSIIRVFVLFGALDQYRVCSEKYIMCYCSLMFHLGNEVSTMPYSIWPANLVWQIGYVVLHYIYLIYCVFEDMSLCNPTENHNV